LTNVFKGVILKVKKGSLMNLIDFVNIHPKISCLIIILVFVLLHSFLELLNNIFGKSSKNVSEKDKEGQGSK
jgi:hypothetical protein